MKKIIASFALLFSLAACAENQPPPVKPEADTSAKINLDVLSVTVIDHSTPPEANSAYASNNFQPTIANALRSWAMEKIVAVGSTGEAVIMIRDASLKSENLSHGDHMFTREQASKYIGRAEIEMSVKGREGSGHVVAEAGQFETLPENPSTRERQNAYTKILNRLSRDIAAKLRANIYDHLGTFVITAPILKDGN
jgi:hypothetical protein